MRARLTPGDVGLRSTGRRLTPGLRRQEVAELAAVSIDWYIRLEQGRVSAPGAGVLDSIAEALRLSPVEREYLHLIARGEVPPRPLADSAAVAPSLLAILDGMPLLPAYVINHRFDVLARNAAAAAFFGSDFGCGSRSNVALNLFRNPHNRVAQLSWDQIARETVGVLRAGMAKYPDDDRLRAVVGELHALSTEFAEWWADRTVCERGNGVKRILTELGVLTLAYDTLVTLHGNEQRLVILTPVDAETERLLHLIITAPPWDAPDPEPLGTVAPTAG